jgi:hypothetical protein
MILETAAPPVPAILDLEQAIDEFRQTIKPWLEPGPETNWDGIKLKEKEWAILQAGLRLVGHCIAILIYQLVLSESVRLAAQVRASGQTSLVYTNQAFKDVTITLIGGVQVRVKTLYKLARQRKKDSRGRKRKRGKRGKSNGQGYYPVLALLGISEGVSPLVRCLVAQAATQAASLDQARQQVAWLGLHFSTRRISRISRAFCQVGLQVRAAQVARFSADPPPAGQALTGKRVVISVDGGRIRIRQSKRTGRKRKNGRRGFRREWKEPKLLTIYVIDEQGHKVTGADIPLVCDGTLMGLEAFMQILHLYLHELGIALADSIVLVADGAPWIWERVPALLHQLGCRAEQITAILDYSHATEHLYDLAEALFGNTPHSKGLARKWAKRLKQGRAPALLTEIEHYLTKKVKDCKAAQREYNYFKEHHAHGRLAYAHFQKQKSPIGSGAVESLIRQVVNLRLKGAGKFWLLETAEAFLHARCQWAAHLWSSFCDTVLTFGLVPILTI